MSILLVAGLPFDGTFWAQVQIRLSSKGFTSETWNLCENEGPIGEQTSALQALIKQKNITTIVAHGFGVPVALQIAANTDLENLIISNGLLSTNIGIINWVWPQISRLPSFVLQSLLRPTISRKVLSSSAMFRRLVVNPYVMDIETLSELTSLLDQPEYRKHICSYFDSLHQWSVPNSIGDTNLHATWGDNDPMFPASQLQTVRDLNPSIEQQCKYIPGGAHFHPVERPWGIADHIISSLDS